MKISIWIFVAMTWGFLGTTALFAQSSATKEISQNTLSPKLLQTKAAVEVEPAIQDVEWFQFLTTMEGIFNSWIKQQDTYSANHYFAYSNLPEVNKLLQGSLSVSNLETFRLKFMSCILFARHEICHDYGHADPEHPKFSAIPRSFWEMQSLWPNEKWADESAIPILSKDRTIHLTIDEIDVMVSPFEFGHIVGETYAVISIKRETKWLPVFIYLE
jgi:hypothetical protein